MHVCDLRRVRYQGEYQCLRSEDRHPVRERCRAAGKGGVSEGVLGDLRGQIWHLHSASLHTYRQSMFSMSSLVIHVIHNDPLLICSTSYILDSFGWGREVLCRLCSSIFLSSLPYFFPFFFGVMPKEPPIDSA